MNEYIAKYISSFLPRVSKLNYTFPFKSLPAVASAENCILVVGNDTEADSLLPASDGQGGWPTTRIMRPPPVKRRFQAFSLTLSSFAGVFCQSWQLSGRN